MQPQGMRSEVAETKAGEAPQTRSPDPLIASSPLRAWCYLVWLSWLRQARARQMVWIALGLLGFAVGLSALNTAQGRWGMNHWRYPRRYGATYPNWVTEVQTVLAARGPTAVGPALENAVLGSCRAILENSGFLVFTRWAVLTLFVSFLLPLLTLSFATEALGGERENQSLVWLLTRPLSRSSVYLGKFLALLPWSLGLTVGGFALVCLVGGAPGRLAFALFWPAVFWGALAFSALFYLMGAFFRRPAVVALVYAFFLEVVLANLPGYPKRVSVGFYTRCMMFEAAGAYGVEPEKPGIYLPVSGTTALIVLAVTTVALLALGTALFARSQYHETV